MEKKVIERCERNVHSFAFSLSFQLTFIAFYLLNFLKNVFFFNLLFSQQLVKSVLFCLNDDTYLKNSSRTNQLKKAVKSKPTFGYAPVVSHYSFSSRKDAS